MATIAFLSDSHLRREAAVAADGPDSMLTAAVAAVAAHRPDLVVLPGDIADDGSAEAYRRVAATVATLGAPVLATPGNHDLAGPLDEVLGTADSFELDGWRVVLIDTHVVGEVPGRIEVGAVMAALGGDRGQPTVLVVHHPPVTLSTHEWFQLDGAGALVALLLSRSDVRVVVAGHLHAHTAQTLGPTTYLVCPSTYYAIAHHRDTYRKHDGLVGALLLDLSPGGSFDWRWIDTRDAGG